MDIYDRLHELMRHLSNPSIDHIESTNAITVRELRSYLDGYSSACNMVIEELHGIIDQFENDKET